MASKKNTACTLKAGQIEKSPVLALGVSAKDVSEYERIAKAYGNVAPVIVGQRGNMYSILSGQAKLEACMHSGLKEIPASVTEISDEAEQMKLALLLSTIREEGGALSEGAFINILTAQHGVARRDLAKLLKKSKSWISKRQSLDARLSGNVKDMVRSGAVCARAAEEIAKLPGDLQAAFAAKTAMEGLSKTKVSQLVDLYRREDTSDAVRGAIISDPLAVLGAHGKPGSMRLERRGAHERIFGSIRLLIRLISDLKGLLAGADAEAKELARTGLDELRSAWADLGAVLEIAGVSPGKQGDAACD